MLFKPVFLSIYFPPWKNWYSNWCSGFLSNHSAKITWSASGMILYKVSFTGYVNTHRLLSKTPLWLWRPVASNTETVMGNLYRGNSFKSCSWVNVSTTESWIRFCSTTIFGWPWAKNHWLKNQFKSSPETSSKAMRNSWASAGLNSCLCK